MNYFINYKKHRSKATTKIYTKAYYIIYVLCRYAHVVMWSITKLYFIFYNFYVNFYGFPHI